MHSVAQLYPAQNSMNSFLVDFFYIFSCTGGFIGMMALALLDAGTVQRAHIIDTMVLKVTCIFVAGAACLVAGYGIWNSQFDQAFGVPHPLWQSLSDWWLGGRYLVRTAQQIDPSALPGADTQQIFVVFFFGYAALIGAFIHSMGVERMKPLACVILSAVAGGLLMPLLTYCTWGPVGPLTNRGLHDFVGAYSLYMFVGTWALIFGWRLGPRKVLYLDPLITTCGVLLLLIAIPLFVIGCGVLVPNQGYYGINSVNSGLGLLYVNIVASLSGGAISASWLGYRLKKPGLICFGPIAGYVGCTALFDIALPWECLAIGFCCPFIMLGGQRLVKRIGIDDPKIAPLALGPAIFSALLAGLIGHGLPSGGLPGLSGAYGFQHARISLGMQAAGVVFTLGFSALTGLALAWILEHTIGLKSQGQSEKDGLDAINWGIPSRGP